MCVCVCVCVCVLIVTNINSTAKVYMQLKIFVNFTNNVCVPSAFWLV
jgi:hypothetical protein